MKAAAPQPIISEFMACYKGSLLDTVASDYRDSPQQYADIFYGVSGGAAGDLKQPAPGAANKAALIQTGPAIRNVTQNLPSPAPGESLVINAAVTATAAPIRSVKLHIRFGYASGEHAPVHDAQRALHIH